MRPIESKWVFVMNEDTNDDIQYKVRLVAKAYAQREGVDYNQKKNSPVVKQSSIDTACFGGTVQIEFGATRCKYNLSSQVSRRINLYVVASMIQKIW